MKHHVMLPGSFSERGHACVRACASGGSAPVPQRRAAQRARAGGQARGERAAARPAGQRGQRVAEAVVQVPGQLALQRRALPRPRARIGLPTLSPGARAATGPCRHRNPGLTAPWGTETRAPGARQQAI
jgi:hypothetical protein